MVTNCGYVGIIEGNKQDPTMDPTQSWTNRALTSDTDNEDVLRLSAACKLGFRGLGV